MSASSSPYPDGLGPDHEGDRPTRRAVNRIALIGLMGLLALAATGLLGGGSRPVLAAKGPQAELQIKTPGVMRSGMFLETQVDVRARQAIAKPVLAISESYWRDITINTVEPSPASEDSKAGMFLFEYEPMEAGDLLRVKFDGQINPSLFAGTQGRIELRDDKRTIVSIPLDLTVLP